MAGGTRAAPGCSLEELKTRGNRLRVQWIEALEILQIVVRESHDLKARIHRIHHHHEAWPLGVFLGFYDAGGAIRVRYPD